MAFQAAYVYTIMQPEIQSISKKPFGGIPNGLFFQAAYLVYNITPIGSLKHSWSVFRLPLGCGNQSKQDGYVIAPWHVCREIIEGNRLPSLRAAQQTGSLKTHLNHSSVFRLPFICAVVGNINCYAMQTVTPSKPLFGYSNVTASASGLPAKSLADRLGSPFSCQSMPTVGSFQISECSAWGL